MSSTNGNTSSDCVSCRLISFTGLTASGAYVAYHARRQPSVFGKGVLGTFALGLTYAGIARLLNIYPFTEKRLKSRADAFQNNG